MTAIEQITQGPDYFQCDLMACRMPKAICVSRQDKAMSFEEYERGRRDIGKKIAYAMCSDCSQGRKIKAEKKWMTPVHRIDVRECPASPLREAPVLTKKEGKHHA